MQDGDIQLVQEKCVLDILKQFEMEGCKSASTPLEPSVRLSVKDSPGDDLEKARMEAYPYRQVVGKLIYLAVCTRPDICQAVSELSRFNSNLRISEHWESAMRVLGYCTTSVGRQMWDCCTRRENLRTHGDMSTPPTQDAPIETRVEPLKSSCQVGHLFSGRAREWGMDLSALVRLSTWDSL